MESKKNLSQNQGIGSSSTKDRATASPATGSTVGSSSDFSSQPTGTTGSTGFTGGQTTASAPQRAREQGTDSTYGQAKHAVTNAYDRTSEVLTNTYDQAMTYGRENPGKLTLIAFGAGIGIGLLLASSVGGGRSRTNRIAEPVINALSQVATEFFR
jgi:ElaB protein